MNNELYKLMHESENILISNIIKYVKFCFDNNSPVFISKKNPLFEERHAYLKEILCYNLFDF